MTTIAATRTEIACDLQATYNGATKIKLQTKIGEFYQPLLWKTPFYVGWAGSLNEVPDMIDWLHDPTAHKKPPKMQNTSCIVLTQDKKLFTFTNPGQWIAINQPVFAVGSGSPYAMGAMEAGASPLAAVKIASKSDPFTGMGFKNYTFVKK